MKRNRVLYLEVADKLKHDIFSGKYPVGTMLPTETELEQLFGVSKITVRKAIELLSADEYVEKCAGRGTTVLSNRPYNKLSKSTSFTQILENSNCQVDKSVLGLEVIDFPEGSDFRQAFKNGRALRFRRLYLLNGKPYIYFVHYLPESLADVDARTFEEESLYRVLNQRGFEISRFEDDFEAVMLSDAERAILGTDSKAAIKRVRRSYDRDGGIVEFSEALYDTAQRAYHIEYET